MFMLFTCETQVLKHRMKTRPSSPPPGRICSTGLETGSKPVLFYLDPHTKPCYRDVHYDHDCDVKKKICGQAAMRPQPK